MLETVANLKKLQRDSLPLGGFAGLKEHQLVKNPHVFGPMTNKDGSWSGLGSFVYLADARFMPHGETRMHDHLEVDVISVMVEGNIAHEGSMGHGQDLKPNDIQVQRAGGEGFSHNEVNPDDEWNRMIQIWALPEEAGLPASYQVYQPKENQLTRIYGGGSDQDFPSKTKIDVTLLKKGQSVEIKEPFMAYITQGKGIATSMEQNEQIEEGDLISGEHLSFVAMSDVQLIIIHTAIHTTDTEQIT